MKHIVLVILFTLVFALPSYAQFDDILNDVKKEVKKEIKKRTKTDTVSTAPDTGTEKEKDDGFVSEFHKIHTRQILFHKGLNMDIKANDINFTGTFNNGETILAAVYLEKSIRNFTVYDKTGQEIKVDNFTLKYYVDGVEEASVKGSLTGKYTSARAFTLLIMDKIETPFDNSVANKIRFNLPAGDHRIKLEMWAGNLRENHSSKEPIARGEFTINVPVKESEKPNGKFSDIPAGMKNADLEQQAIQIINDKASRENWKERYSAAVINSKDWQIIKHEYTGIILSRKVYMTLLGTWPDGTCRVTEFSFLQDYDGLDYQNTLQYNAIGGMQTVYCE